MKVTMERSLPALACCASRWKECCGWDPAPERISFDTVLELTSARFR